MQQVLEYGLVVVMYTFIAGFIYDRLCRYRSERLTAHSSSFSEEEKDEEIISGKRFIETSGFPAEVVEIIDTMMGRVVHLKSAREEQNPRLDSAVRDAIEIVKSYRSLGQWASIKSEKALLKGVSACAQIVAEEYASQRRVEEQKLRTLALAAINRVAPSSFDLAPSVEPLPLVDHHLRTSPVHSPEPLPLVVRPQRTRDDSPEFHPSTVEAGRDEKPKVPRRLRNIGAKGEHIDRIDGCVEIGRIKAGTVVDYIGGDAVIRYIEPGVHIRKIGGSASIWQAHLSTIGKVGGRASIRLMTECTVDEVSGRALISSNRNCVIGSVGAKARVLDPSRA